MALRTAPRAVALSCGLVVCGCCDLELGSPSASEDADEPGPPYCQASGGLLGSDTRDDVDYPGKGGTLGMGSCDIVDYQPCGVPLMAEATYHFGVRMMRTTTLDERSWSIESDAPHIARAEVSDRGGRCGFGARIETFSVGRVGLQVRDDGHAIDRFELEVLEGGRINVRATVGQEYVLFDANSSAPDGSSLKTPSLHWKLADTDVVGFDDLGTPENETLQETEGSLAVGIVRGEGVAQGLTLAENGLGTLFEVTVPQD